jgi:hypothetical protein
MVWVLSAIWLPVTGMCRMNDSMCWMRILEAVEAGAIIGAMLAPSAATDSTIFANERCTPSVTAPTPLAMATVKISGLTALLYLPLLGEPGGWDKSAARRSYVAQT